MDISLKQRNDQINENYQKMEEYNNLEKQFQQAKLKHQLTGTFMIEEEQLQHYQAKPQGVSEQQKTVASLQQKISLLESDKNYLSGESMSHLSKISSLQSQLEFLQNQLALAQQQS